MKVIKRTIQDVCQTCNITVCSIIMLVLGVLFLFWCLDHLLMCMICFVSIFTLKSEWV